MIVYRCEKSVEEADCAHATRSAWYADRQRDVKAAALASLVPCRCSTCIFDSLSKRVIGERADRLARELVEEEEALKRKAVEKNGLVKKPTFAKKKPRPKEVRKSSEAATPKHVADVREPAPLLDVTLNVEEVSESFRLEQARILEEIERSTQHTCDLCFESTPARAMATCDACGARATCTACVHSLRDIGARCTRCFQDMY